MLLRNSLATLLLLAGCASQDDARVARTVAPPAIPAAQAAPAAPAATGADRKATSAPGVDVAAINLPFKNLTDVQSWVEKFERESREIYAKRVEIADAVRIQPGECVADVGAGTGLFEPYFATAVGPAGRVFAVDIAPLFLDHIRRRALADGIGNVETVLAADDSTNLAADSVDLVFVCDVYHHFEHPDLSLVSIHRALHRNGRFVVVDFEKEPGVASDFVMKHVRAGKAEVVAEIRAAGFEVEREEKLLKENWFIAFRKSR